MNTPGTIRKLERVPFLSVNSANLIFFGRYRVIITTPEQFLQCVMQIKSLYGALTVCCVVKVGVLPNTRVSGF